MSYSLIFAPRAMADFDKIKKSGDQARLAKRMTKDFYRQLIDNTKELQLWIKSKL